MTETEAEDLLKQLTKHYGEPVLPLEQFCLAMRTWFGAIRTNVARGGDHGRAYALELGMMDIDIRKSDLLARLLFGGEKLRTVPCPEHKGRQDTHALVVGTPCACGGTGWLPEA